MGGFDIVRQGAQVRAAIGAALQEAALDAILTGREHLMLQATLQGLPARRARARAEELLERVGLTEAADRRVGGYSGGMKRRLDLALALVHSPRILFLDEPTTGLDPQSRAALWEEVARLAHDEGMTVFLTTQYLEEADVLADRIGIIDHGRIVAEGTPAELKAEIGSPSVEVAPADPSRRPAGELLARLRRDAPQRPRERHRAAARRRGAAGRDRPRARSGRPARRDAAAAPALARRRVPGQDRPQARGRRATRPTDGATTAAGAAQAEAAWPLRRSRPDRELLEQVGAVARRSVARTLRQRGLLIFPMVFPLILFAINGSAAQSATQIPGFPTDNYRDFLIAMPFIQGAMFVSITAGVDLARDIESGFLNRLALTPLRGEALLIGQLGGALVLGIVQAIVYLLVGLATGVTLVSGVGGAFVLLALSILIAFALRQPRRRCSRCASAPARRSRGSSRCCS